MRLTRAVLWSLALACLTGCTSVRVTRQRTPAPRSPSRVYVIHDHDRHPPIVKRTPKAEPPVVRDPRRGPPDHAPAHGYRRNHGDEPWAWDHADDHPGQVPEHDPGHPSPDGDPDADPGDTGGDDDQPPGQAKKKDGNEPPGQAKKDDGNEPPGQAKKDDDD